MNPMNWPVVYPEALLLLLACAVALVDLYVTDPKRRLTFWLAQASLAAVAALHWIFYDGGATIYGMQRMMVGDPMGHLLAFFATLAVMVWSSRSGTRHGSEPAALGQPHVREERR